MKNGKVFELMRLRRLRARLAAASAIAGFLALTVTTADAAVLRISENAFVGDANLITFSEFATGTTNPTYAPADYGADPITAPTVTFGGFFEGQMFSDAPGTDCPGGATTACVVGSPTNELTLEPGSPATFISEDQASPTPPVLSGTPRFAGPIAIQFDRDMAGVGLDGGFFNASGSAAIAAFARDGTFLGSVTNQGTRIEFLGLMTDDGSERIAGLLFSIVGEEPAGVGIDNLRFGDGDDVVIPLPATLPLLFSSLVGLGFLGWKRSKAA